MRWASRRSGRRRSASGSGWRRSRQLVLALGPDAVFARLAVFFSQMAVVTFGGAYAVLAYVAQAAEGYGWVTAGEMLDGLGMAETKGAIPMGAVAVSDRVNATIADAAPEAAIEFFHGYTYSAHPAACAAGLATLQIYEDEGLFECAAELADYFLDAVWSLRDLP